MNILIINGHQRYEGFAEGKLTQTIIDATQKQLTKAGHAVDITNIEKGYEVETELKKYLWADAVFVQIPAYWMSAPWIFKKYADEIYTAGIGEVLCKDDGRTRSDLSKKYGSGGLMTGKKYMISTTWNAPAEAFEDPTQFFEGKGVDGPFMWLHKTYQFFGMEPLPSFSCHDVLKDADVPSDLIRLKEHLAAAF